MSNQNTLTWRVNLSTSLCCWDPHRLYHIHHHCYFLIQKTWISWNICSSKGLYTLVVAPPPPILLVPHGPISLHSHTYPLGLISLQIWPLYWGPYHYRYGTHVKLCDSTLPPPPKRKSSKYQLSLPVCTSHIRLKQMFAILTVHLSILDYAYKTVIICGSTSTVLHSRIQ